MNPEVATATGMDGNGSMTLQAYVTLVLLCGAFLYYILHKLRRKKIGETHALLWLSFGSALFLFVAIPHSIDALRLVTGIYYPPMAFFGIIIAFLLVVVLRLHSQVYLLRKNQANLVQKLAQLELESHRNGSGTKPEAGAPK